MRVALGLFPDIWRTDRTIRSARKRFPFRFRNLLYRLCSHLVDLQKSRVRLDVFAIFHVPKESGALIVVGASCSRAAAVFLIQSWFCVCAVRVFCVVRTFVYIYSVFLSGTFWQGQVLNQYLCGLHFRSRYRYIVVS